MAIDSAAERISATNQLIGLRVLLPNGSIDQSNRQASARTVTAILAIAPIVFLDSAIDIKPAVNASYAMTAAIDSVLSLKPAVNANPGMNE